MKQIDRLLRKARNAYDQKGRFLTASVEYDDRKGKFVAGGSTYNPKGSDVGERFGAEFDTLQEALVYVDNLAGQYQACDKLTFIIDDLTFPEEDALYLKQINEQETMKDR